MRLLILLFVTNTFCDDITFVNNYLTEYGYKEKSEETNLEDLSQYITIFQEFHKLTVDGQMNNETLSLMKTPRCGNKDLEDFQVSKIKWNTTTIKWHYYLARPNVISLAKQAFNFWERYSGLTFEHSRNDYNILISDKRPKHNLNYNSNIPCSELYKGILAHAYLPYLYENMTEIHMNSDVTWYYKNDTNVPPGEISFLYVLIHEIGHSLGISHSTDNRAIMFSSYNLKNGIDLSNDDKLAIQSLYGLPSTQNTTTQKTTTHTTTTQTNTTQTTQQTVTVKSEEVSQDLCSIRNVNKFLMINKRIYIVHDKMFWVIQDKRYDSPRLLIDWLSFLPRYFHNIQGMYQRPSDEVVLIIDSVIYIFHMHNLQLKTRLYLNHIGINNNPKINCIFNTYTGKTILIYNDEYYSEIDECSFRVKHTGYLIDRFNGLPKGINSCFRYTDGFLYFFKGEDIYKYSEFENEYQKINVHPLSIVNVKCATDTIKNIIELLQSMIN